MLLPCHSSAEEANKGDKKNTGPTARDANTRAFLYFTKYYPAFGIELNWDFNPRSGNPINGYFPGLPVDDPVNQAALHNNMRHPGFWDAFLTAISWF